MRYLKSLLIFIAMFSTFTFAFGEDGYKTSYVQISRQSAVLYQPVESQIKSSIGIVVMHSNDNYLGFIANSELAKRGYTVIATIPSAGDMMDDKLLNIKNCIDYLRKMNGVKKVLLLGHSGGATVMTAYELLAEKGVAVLKDKLFSDYSADLSNLPKADGILLLDANYGNSIMRLISLDPNIKSAGKGIGAKEILSLTDAKVGFNPKGSSNYSEAFKVAYSQAQRERMESLISFAIARLQAIKSGKGDYSDDEPFVIAGANQIRFYNKLFPQDLSLLAHTKKEWTLLHGDGSVTTEVVHSVRAPMAISAKPEKLDAAMTTTVKGFLSSSAIRLTKNFKVTATGFEGIQWTSNINNPVGNAEGITIPILMMGMTGSWEYLAAEHIYNHCPSKDKSIAFVEGASHMFFADPDAEKFNQKSYGNTVKVLFDYVDQWISTNGRFL